MAIDLPDGRREPNDALAALRSPAVHAREVVPHSANALRSVSGPSQTGRVLATASRPRVLKAERLQELSEGGAPLARPPVEHGTATRRPCASE